jgi:GH43 family beta-xylosidase
MPLTEFKAISRTVGCTVNDVVIATVAGAVREFLRLRHVQPRKIDFRIAAPVSVRRREERGRLGNRISAWVVHRQLLSFHMECEATRALANFL